MYPLLALLVLAYGVLVFAFWAGQAKLVFHPDAELVADPAAFGIEYENIRFVSEDGTILHGWYFPGKDNGPVVLFCHGNAGNVSFLIDSAQVFLRLGASVFVFDYRGFGQSEARPLTEEGTLMDARAAYSWLVQSKGIPESRIIVLGRSLGGVHAAHVASRNQPHGLILESAFTSLPEIGKQLHPYLPVHLLSRYQYNTQMYLEKVTCPVLIIHSTQDELIPFSHAQSLFAKASEPKTLLQITGDHNEGYFTSGIVYPEGLSTYVRDLGFPF